MSWKGTLQKAGIDYDESNDFYTFLTAGVKTVSGTPTYVVTGMIADISTAETIYIPCPHAGQISEANATISAAITVADAGITVSTSTGALTETIDVLTAGSAAGTTVTITPSLTQTNNTIPNNSYISIATDGASTTAAQCIVAVTIIPE